MTNRRSMSYTLTVRIDLMLAEQIAVLARQTNQPVSAVVREALSRHVAETQAPRATTLLRAAGSVRGEGQSATNENVRAKLRARRAKR